MMHFSSMIKGDYLQRTRSYAFLITLAVSLYIAYTFVPAPDAAYTTVRIGNFVGAYNSAWIGYVTAIMTSVFLSLIGFYLINNSVKKDIETEVGMIVATTQVSNFKYLMSKVLSNFLVLLSIVGLVFIMSIFIFFFRSSGFPFEISQFILPYLIVTLPSIFVVASAAVVAEVLLPRKYILQYIGFFILFNVVIANVQMNKGTELLTYLDPFGVKVVSMGLEEFVKTNHGVEAYITSMGFNFGPKKDLKIFIFNGMSWPVLFLLSRVLWICFGVGWVFVASIFFHRFDVREKLHVKKKDKFLLQKAEQSFSDVRLSSLPSVVTDYRIWPFIKTELLMLFRKGPRWFWFVNLGGVIALLFTPLTIAHQIILPILWFLQIGRWSDIATKEKSNRIHYFTYAAYQPLKRLLPSQVLAGIILAVALASPLLLRYLLLFEFVKVTGILAGAIFIVMLSVFLGIVSAGKKLFEILFFMTTYANLNLIPFADYFGGGWTTYFPLSIVLGLTAILFLASWSIRGYEIRNAA